MKAAVVDSLIDGGKVTVREVPIPLPTGVQVRVRTHAIGVGYVDVMSRAGAYPFFPGVGSILGLEAAGIVEAVGPEADANLLGRRVFALPAFGAYAEHVLVDAERVFTIPESLAAAEAVALGLNALVAEIGLNRAVSTETEDVLIRGASGGIGVLATQIAAARGCSVVAVTSAPDKARRLTALGAQRVVTREQATAGNASYDIIVDTVGSPNFAAHMQLLRANGCYLLCGAAGGAPTGSDLATVMDVFHRSPTLMAFSLNSVSADDLQSSWQRVMAFLSAGRIEPIVDRKYNLADAARALQAIEAGSAFGKVILEA